MHQQPLQQDLRHQVLASLRWPSGFEDVLSSVRALHVKGRATIAL